MNIAATNLGGTNLGGMNLGGMNLGGMNLGGSNLGGRTWPAPTWRANLAGMNLAGINLAGANTGSNLHNLPGPINGMLYSGEDLWLPKTGQRIVLGHRLDRLRQAARRSRPRTRRISVALGKLPWGFAGHPRGARSRSRPGRPSSGATRATASFVLVAPPGSSWAGVAGFIKAVFRWNAPPPQSMDISGIEASAPHDPDPEHRRSRPTPA